MRQVSIKQLYSNLSGELKDLPFEIAKNGKPVAVVVSLDKMPNPYGENLDRLQSLDATGIELRPYSKEAQIGKIKK